MGQVVPFIARVRDSGDWTASERARLEELADRLAAGGVRVEAIFGATDEGDPWCVVTDADGDVLIHVARIDGKFVVHSAIDDAVNESVDLHTALRDRLAATEEMVAPTSATILPFTARQAQTFLALLAATAFFYETSAVGDTAEAGEPVQALPPSDPPQAPSEVEAATQERESAQGVALQPADRPSTAVLTAEAPTRAAAAPAEPGPTPPPTPVEAPRAAPAEQADVSVAAAGTSAPALVIQGTAGDDLLVGSAADEHIVGGDGNDTLRGGGGHDLLEGGQGDDVIEVTGQSVAVGGAGADTFVIQAPAQTGQPNTLLGVILDFTDGEGDRLFNSGGGMIRFVQHRPTPDADKQAPPTTDGDTGLTTQTNPPTHDPDPSVSGGGFGPTTIGPPTLAPPPLTRVDVDLDGDGVADGYLLLGLRAVHAGLPINATAGASLGVDPLG